MIAARRQKQPREVRDFTIDFTNNLYNGSVSSVVVTSRNAETGVASTATIIASSSVSHPYVTIRVHQGTAGDTHVVECLTTLSGGQKIEDEIILAIVEY